MVDTLINLKKMINYGIYENELPILEVVNQGTITQIFFNFEDVQHTEEDGESGTSQAKHFRCDLVEVDVLDYGNITSSIVRSKYSQDDVEAILSNYQLCKDGEAPEGKCDDYQQRYTEYQEWRATAKNVASQVLNR